MATAGVMPDPTAATPAQAQVAFTTALGIGEGVNASAQKVANRWLGEYAKTAGAWSTCIGLLTSAGDARVPYFAANMLLSKVRSEWPRMSDADKVAKLGLLMKPLQAAGTTAGVQHRLVQQRLAQVVGSASALTGGESLQLFLNHAFSLAAPGTATSATVTLALDLLSGLATETLARAHVNKKDVIAALSSHMPKLVGLIEMVATGGSAPSATAAAPPAALGPMAADALNCLRHYLQAGVTLAALHTHAGGRLLRVIVAGLGADDDTLLEAASDTLVDLLGQAATVRYPRRRGGGGAGAFVPPVESEASHACARAIAVVAAGVAAQEKRFRAAVAASEADVCRFLCRVIVGVGEAAIDYLAGGSDGAMALIGMLLECSQHEDTNVAELAMEFWPTLQAVPRAHRAEPLRDELFTRVLERCMRGSTYPDDVASWSTPEMDDFQKYREVLCADALEACFEELEERFVEYCGGMLAHAASGDGGWETAEVVLFATRAAALKIKGYLRLAADPGDPMLGEHQAAVHQFLANVFTAIARHADVVTCHFAVVQSGARCIQMFGAWLAKHDALVNGAVGYALKALRLGPTADFAAGALATLCSRCAKKFRNKATVSQLVESLDAGVKAGMPLQARKTVTEAVARLAAGLPRQEMVASLQQLVGPVVANIAASVGAGVAVDDASTARVAEELEVLAGVIRFTEVTNRGTAARGSATTTATGGNGGAGGDAEGVHPVVTLMEIAWPLCTQAAAKFGSQPRVASSLCSVFSSVVQAAKWDAAPLLPGMMAQAVAMFTAHRHVCWLEFVGVPAQVYGPKATSTESAVYAQLHPPLAQVCGHVFKLLGGWLQAGTLRDGAAVLRGFWDMLHLYLAFCPVLVVQPALLGRLFQAATACAGMDEYYAVRAVLVFFKTVVGFKPPSGAGAGGAGGGGAGGVGGLRATVDAAVAEHGTAAAKALLVATADTLPASLHHAAALAILPFVQRYPQLMHAAAVAALGAPDFPGASSWTDGAKSTFVNLLVAAPGVEAGKRAPGVTPIAAANAEAWFVEVVKDFAMISRGRAPCDTLYRHTRPSAS